MEWAARGGNATPLLLSPGTEQVQLLQSSSLASKLVACLPRKVAQVSWCSVDEHVPHDGNGVILLRWGAYLEAAERDHAVHHLGHAEAVPEIVKGVVSVIVMNTQLQREGMKLSETGELFLCKNMITYASQPPWKHCISLQESYGAQYFLLAQSDSTRLFDTLCLPGGGGERLLPFKNLSAGKAHSNFSLISASNG